MTSLFTNGKLNSNAVLLYIAIGGLTYLGLRVYETQAEEREQQLVLATTLQTAIKTLESVQQSVLTINSDVADLDRRLIRTEADQFSAADANDLRHRLIDYGTTVAANARDIGRLDRITAENRAAIRKLADRVE